MTTQVLVVPKSVIISGHGQPCSECKVKVEGESKETRVLRMKLSQEELAVSLGTHILGLMRND